MLSTEKVFILPLFVSSSYCPFLFGNEVACVFLFHFLGEGDRGGRGGGMMEIQAEFG